MLNVWAWKVLAFAVPAAVLVSSGFLYRDHVAQFVWDYTKWDAVALSINAENSGLATEIGLYYFGGGAYDLERAKRAFEETIVIDSSVPGIRYQLGRIHFIQGNFGHAIYVLTRELELYPDHLRPLYVRGLVYGYRGLPGDLALAEEDFANFNAWASGEWAGYNDLAWIQTRREKFSDARDTVHRAFDAIWWVKQGNPWLWTTLGIAELNLGNYNEARDAFLIARRYSEEMSPGYFMTAYPGNDSRNAEELFNQYQATLSFNLGIASEHLDDTISAIAEYESYLVLLPRGPYPSRAEVEGKIRELVAQ